MAKRTKRAPLRSPVAESDEDYATYWRRHAEGLAQAERDADLRSAQLRAKRKEEDDMATKFVVKGEKRSALVANMTPAEKTGLAALEKASGKPMEIIDATSKPKKPAKKASKANGSMVGSVVAMLEKAGKEIAKAKAPAVTKAKAVKAKAKAAKSEAPAVKSAPVEAPGKTPLPNVKPGSKAALVLSLVCRKSGATMEQLCKATGWAGCTSILSRSAKSAGVTLSKEKQANGTLVYKGVK